MPVYNTSDSSNATVAVGGVPASNESVIFSEPGPAITTNLSGYVNNLDLFHETRNFAGDIGLPATGLFLDSDLIRLEGSGSFGHFIGTGKTWPILYLDPANTLREFIFQDITAITAMALNSGRSAFKSTVADIAAAYINGGHHDFEGVTGTNAISAAIVAGRSNMRALARLYRKVTTLTVGAFGSAELLESFIAPTTVNVWPGGRLIVKNSGSIGTLNTYSGTTVDYSKMGRDVVLTNWTVYGPTIVIRPRAGVDGWHESDVVTAFNNLSGYPIVYREAA